MIDAFLNRRPASAPVDDALLLARGMNFAQFKADIERLEITYPFVQIDKDVPIEHTLLLATRWEGQTVTSVRGTMIHRYQITNTAPDLVRCAKEQQLEGTSAQTGCAEVRRNAVSAARAALQEFKQVQDVSRSRYDTDPVGVLLPYGNTTSGEIALRYAWRLVITGYMNREEMPFLTWLDAQSAQILKMEPLFNDATGARGKTWRRDPGTGGERNSFFTVDDAVSSQYALSLTDMANRVDFLEDGDTTNDVSISSAGNGSSGTLANFNQNTDQ